MERTATHETEYVDIVLGYHHILVFSLVFGVLIFGTGFFIGYYRARSDHADRAAVQSTTTPQSSSAAPAGELPPVQMPAVLTQPQTQPAGDVVQEMEKATSELAPNGAAPTGTGTPAPPAADSTAASEAAATQAAVTAAVPAAEPPSVPAPAPAPAKPAAAPPPVSHSEPAANGQASAPAAKPAPRADAKPANAGGNVYLQVSTFDAQQEAEKLTNELAAEGFRALIDGELVEGRHTVLVGPFSDFKSAVGKAKELKEHNREAFPIRR